MVIHNAPFDIGFLNNELKMASTKYPKILLTDKETLKKEASKYLEIFKDHPYIFNLGHGILPETNPGMVEKLIKIVKNFK